jgi:hypothetical protein
VKAGRGEATPLIRLAVGSFTSKEYGKIACPSFEIANKGDLATELELIGFAEVTSNKYLDYPIFIAYAIRPLGRPERLEY